LSVISPMKKTLFLLLFGILMYSCSSSKIDNGEMRYFDDNNFEITKSKFDSILSNNKLLIYGDSSSHRKLVLRENHGELSDRAVLESLLEDNTNQELDSNKPIVIIYYPGKDKCNSTGTAKDKELIKISHEKLEVALDEIAQIKPIYLYKNNDGLKNYNGIVNWHKDPEGTIERLFFKYHYPCGSFVVISKNGNYISYFGEYPKEYVWKATQLMNE